MVKTKEEARRAALLKHMKANAHVMSVKKKPASKPIKKKPASKLPIKKKPAKKQPSRLSPLPAWMKVMNCAITALEYAGYEGQWEGDDMQSSTVFCMYEELREILKTAERQLIIEPM